MFIFSGLKIQDCPPELPESGADSIYSYDNLPSKHQKKYMYASRFIQLVRAKTPKVTYYSAKAKCDLMENLENFEMSFYDGAKIIRTTENQVRIADCDGNAISMTSVSNGDDSVRALWMHYQQCFEHCRLLEQALTNIQCDGECFPIIVGRRPAEVPVSKFNTGSNLLTPKLPNVSLIYFQYHFKVFKPKKIPFIFRHHRFQCL